MTDTIPGADLNPDKMPGHWLLARMGKRVLRPGGRATTESVLRNLAIAGNDDVVELAPGLGATAELILAAHPATYTAVERDPDAVRAVTALVRPTTDRCVGGTAQSTGLASESADVVVGEAFLTMQSQQHKEQIVAEAFRILRPGGRYGLHELSLRPDDLDPATQDTVRAALRKAIHVGARPLTPADWRALVEQAGFEVRHQSTVGMLLLEPRRIIDDEGWRGAARIVVNVLRTPAARRRVRSMRAAFRQHRDHLGAIGLVAVKPTAPTGEGAVL